MKNPSLYVRILNPVVFIHCPSHCYINWVNISSFVIFLKFPKFLWFRKRRNISLCEWNKGKLHFYSDFTFTVLSLQSLVWQNTQSSQDLLSPIEQTSTVGNDYFSVQLNVFFHISAEELPRNEGSFLTFSLFFVSKHQ